ncbi:hypothetical protein [Hymenobacter cheonanensis]|uniref:hypothetical protein n=1 Tax=Hymenobacter sp. CA2-7 TaxID=3063993 RepID=UPI00272D13B9|nr:hypothetical protein [Hymenobacter sp. CA2-7]
MRNNRAQLSKGLLKKAHIAASHPGHSHQIQRFIMLNTQFSYRIDNHKIIRRFNLDALAASPLVSP